jgi:hypothetical protein
MPLASDSFGNAMTAIEAIATVGLLVAAVLAGRTAAKSVGVAAEGINQQIEEQRRIEQRRRTYELLGIYMSADFLQRTADVLPMLNVFNDDRALGEQRWKEISEKDKVAVTAVLNFYELVATEYNAGFLERDVADKHLAYATIVMWERTRGIVAWLRASNERYYEQWKYLYDTRRTVIEAATGVPQLSTPPQRPQP